MKKRILKNWVVKVLGGVIVSYVGFAIMTIDNLGNAEYDRIFIAYTLITFISYILLNMYSNVFDN